MKAFKFSLQVVLEQATNEKDQAAIRLKEIMDQIQRLEKQKEDLQLAIRNYEKKIEYCSTSEAFKEIKVYIEDLSKRIQLLDKRLRDLEPIKEERLEELKKAKIKESTFEKIKEKNNAQYLEDIKKDEDRNMEELVSYKVYTQIK